MGSLSEKPHVPKTPSFEEKHPVSNIIISHRALENISKKGELHLKRTSKTYNLELFVNGVSACKFRGKSLCHALQGLIKKYESLYIREGDGV